MFVLLASLDGIFLAASLFAKIDDFNTIQTTDILSVDLNSYLYELEYLLAKWFREISEQ